MDSSDLEEDIEQYIEKVLDEEEQETQGGRRDSKRESTEETEEDIEQYVEEVLHEPEEQKSEPTSQLEILKELDEGLIFEEAADKPEQLEQPEVQEPERDSEEKELEDLIEERLSEDEADKPEELGKPEEQEPERGPDQEDRGELEEKRIFEEQEDEQAELGKPEKQGGQRSSQQEKIEDFIEEHLFEEETESGPRAEALLPGERRQKGRRRIGAIFVIGLIALMGIGAGYLYLKQEKITVSATQGSGSDQTVSVSTPHDEVLVLEPFVIPAEGNKNFTYVFLSISIKLPNKEVKREVTEKKRPLRGIIYDTLAREIANTKEVPPLETLKQHIIGGVNGALSNGKISEVFISKFLAV
jgi:flagellar basal body-associated protein FliL